MGARTAPALALRSSGRLDLPVSLARWTVCVTMGLLLLVALMMLARRVAGALVQPIDASGLLATGTTLAAGCALLRIWWRHSAPAGRLGWLDHFVLWLPAVSVVLLAGSLSLPGSSLWALSVFWMMLVGEESASVLVGLRGAGEGGLVGWVRPAPEAHRGETDPVTGSAGEAPAPDRPGEAEPRLLPSNVSQQLTRAREEDDTEVLYGKLRAEFTPGQRLAILHVAFCPPLPTVPDLTAEQLDGPPVEIKRAQVQPYGARLDLRLRSPSRDRQGVLLEFYARAKSTGESGESVIEE